MLAILTIVIMLVVGYAQLREGLFTAFTLCINILIAGLVAFNFWEPLAAEVEPMVKDTFMEGCEDALCLIVLFGATLGLLRVAVNSLANKEVEFPAMLQQIGGGVFGMVAGYLVAGFLVCVLQTLPLRQDFMWFDYQLESKQGNLIRHLLPPDRVWLGLMQRAGAYAFSNEEDKQAKEDARQAGRTPTLEDSYVTFDKYSTFELRYGRYRRYTDDPKTPLPYMGEFDKEIHFGKP
jgi:uncharacterized membrane protein required for colicin V production